MKFLARFPESGSFCAGLLIGFSIVTATFAATASESGIGQTMLIVGAPIILLLGITLQLVVTATPRQRHATTAGRELRAS